MQNKYKLPPDVRKSVIHLVEGYERRKRKIKAREDDILSISSVRYETALFKNGKSIEECRVYTPGGKGKKSSPVEDAALKLEKLHNSFDYKCVKAIDEALESLPLHNYENELAARIKKAIIVSCAIGKKFKFRYSGIVGIEASYFYALRSRFLYIIAVKLDFI